MAEHSLGSKLSPCTLNAIALPGAVPLVGELRLLGTKVSWRDFPKKWGGPWALHPAVFFSKLCCFCFWYLVRDLEPCSGNVKRFVALGLLSSFGCPLSFGPVRFLCLLCFGVPGWGCIVPTTVLLG